jgi:hypothetical protein
MPQLILVFLVLCLLGILCYSWIKKSSRVDKLLNSIINETDIDIEKSINKYQEIVDGLKQKKKDNEKISKEIEEKNKKIDKIVK